MKKTGMGGPSNRGTNRGGLIKHQLVGYRKNILASQEKGVWSNVSLGWRRSASRKGGGCLSE